ncbi:MAG: ABC transporter substrate-binding protein [Pseudomonas sp.]|uniref:ABC transporter substrate-binding protein n=1 Tax=Pseudomonas abieticivorans TaxID=2931382 RepID=UPI0020BD56C4|nr:ABC transporter substrate-binding protein [Pseudomonas sp. PIA16]MDE1166623.1 ABC transporter substrate-binding protein [Pseudomonas sp.]
MTVHPLTAALRSTALAVALLAGAQAQAATPITFITNWYAQAEHGGFYQAQADGLYARQGLDVTVQMGGPQVNPVQLLAAGRAQCIISDDIGTMLAREHGVPLQMVATTFQHDPSVIIAHAGVAKIEDLRSQTLLISSAAHSSWWPWAKARLGFKDDQVRPYTFNIQPFMADPQVAQQGYLTSEPFALQKAGAPFKVFALSEAGYPPYGNAIACDSQWLEKNPQQAAAFIQASMQGLKNYLANPAGGNALIRQANPQMGEDQLDYAVAKLRSTGLVSGGDAQAGGIGVITPARMQQTWQMAVDNHLIDAGKVPLEQMYTTRFIDQQPVLP